MNSKLKNGTLQIAIIVKIIYHEFISVANGDFKGFSMSGIKGLPLPPTDDDLQLPEAPKGAGKGKGAGRGLGSERPNGSRMGKSMERGNGEDLSRLCY